MEVYQQWPCFSRLPFVDDWVLRDHRQKTNELDSVMWYATLNSTCKPNENNTNHSQKCHGGTKRYTFYNAVNKFLLYVSAQTQEFILPHEHKRPRLPPINHLPWRAIPLPQIGESLRQMIDHHIPQNTWISIFKYIHFGEGEDAECTQPAPLQRTSTVPSRWRNLPVAS